jgi:hypothetical protein
MGQRCVLSPPGHCERGGCPHLRPGPTLRCALTVRFFVCALCRRSNAQRTPIWLRCMPCPLLCAVAHAVHSLLFYADGMLCLACFTAGGDVEEGTACGTAALPLPNCLSPLLVEAWLCRLSGCRACRGWVGYRSVPGCPLRSVYQRHYRTRHTRAKQ